MASRLIWKREGRMGDAAFSDEFKRDAVRCGK
jgi:hypothetical protein